MDNLFPGAEAAAFRLHDFMGLVTILLGSVTFVTFTVGKPHG